MGEYVVAGSSHETPAPVPARAGVSRLRYPYTRVTHLPDHSDLMAHAFFVHIPLERVFVRDSAPVSPDDFAALRESPAAS